jgi:hypothetical protein
MKIETILQVVLLANPNQYVANEKPPEGGFMTRGKEAKS